MAVVTHGEIHVQEVVWNVVHVEGEVQGCWVPQAASLPLAVAIAGENFFRRHATGGIPGCHEPPEIKRQLYCIFFPEVTIS